MTANNNGATRTFEVPMVARKEASITWNKGEAAEVTKRVIYKFHLDALETPDELTAVLLRPLVINETNRRRAKAAAETIDGHEYDIFVKKPGAREMTIEGIFKKLLEKHRVDPATKLERPIHEVIGLATKELEAMAAKWAEEAAAGLEAETEEVAEEVETK